MKARVIIFISLIGLTTLSNCGKIADTMWVHYDETACFDAWGGNYETPEEEKKKKIKKYLKEKDIKVFEVEIVNIGPPAACMACFCTSGNRIDIKIRKKDLSKAEDENFHTWK